MAYPAVKPDILTAGAEYVDVNATFSNAVTSENLVTAAAWPGHPEWMRKFLVLLGTKIVA
jgi:protease I